MTNDIIHICISNFYRNLKKKSNIPNFFSFISVLHLRQMAFMQHTLHPWKFRRWTIAHEILKWSSRALAPKWSTRVSLPVSSSGNVRHISKIWSRWITWVNDYMNNLIWIIRCLCRIESPRITSFNLKNCTLCLCLLRLLARISRATDIQEENKNIYRYLGTWIINVIVCDLKVKGRTSYIRACNTFPYFWFL